MVELSVKVADKHPQDDELQALEQGMSAAVLAELQRMARNITRNVPGDNPHVINSRLNTADTWQPLRDVLADWLRKSAIYGAEIGRDYVEREVFGLKNIDPARILLDGVVWDLVNESVVNWSLAHSATLVQGVQSTTRRTIMQLVADWAQNSESMSTLVDRLVNDLSFSEARANLIATTEITRAFYEGNKEAWTQSGVIEGKRFQTAVDERVCPLCGPLHGKIAPLSGSFESPVGPIDGPPVHPRCRCWVSPIPIQG